MIGYITYWYRIPKQVYDTRKVRMPRSLKNNRKKFIYGQADVFFVVFLQL